jgi:hypothetical protein
MIKPPRRETGDLSFTQQITDMLLEMYTLFVGLIPHSSKMKWFTPTLKRWN